MAPSILTCSMIFVTVLFIQLSDQAPLVPESKYLVSFGYLDSEYLNPESSLFLSEETLKSAVERFQTFAGIQVTGVLDDDTLAMMKRPRCGVADFPPKEFTWLLTNLTYTISNYSRSLSTDKVDTEIQKAFEIWSRVTPLTFSNTTSEPFHIDVGFHSGDHGDGDPFDGPGGIFGHAYPKFKSHIINIHFDNEENWTDNNSNRDMNLFHAAAHEVGHALGLPHSEDKASVMHPFYKGCESTFELNQDDVKAVQEKYGKKHVAK